LQKKCHLRLLASLAFVAALGPCDLSAGQVGLVGEDGVKPPEYEGLIVDSISIDNRNIYDTDQKKYSGFLFKLVNRLHYRTRQHVVRRELLLQKGDPFSWELAEETARNLRNRLAIYQARVGVRRLQDDRLLLGVTTTDQWSLAGGVEIKRDGNETDYRLWGEEKNLLGRNLFASVEYFMEATEDDYFATRFIDERVLNRPFRFIFGYSNSATGSYTQFSFSRPFYNLRQRFGFNISMLATGGRVDNYRNEVRISESDREGDLASFQAEYRFGSYKRKLSLIGQHTYRYEDVFANRILADNADDSATAISGLPIDSVYHENRLAVQLSNVDFMTGKHIDGYGYVEDITTGQIFLVGFTRAFEPDYDEYLYDAVELQLSQRYRVHSHLFSLTYSRIFWFRGGDDHRRISTLTANYYNNGLSFFTLAMRALYWSDWNSRGDNYLNLGGESGLRGYDKYFRDGNRLAVANVEGRFFSDVEILSVSLGGAVFSDFGRTWRAGEPLKFRDFYASVGVGLRLFVERTSKGRVLRFDLSYSNRKDWQFSVGTGQYFSARANSFLLTIQ